MQWHYFEWCCCGVSNWDAHCHQYGVDVDAIAHIYKKKSNIKTKFSLEVLWARLSQKSEKKTLSP
jgi:hypothetical protein